MMPIQFFNAAAPTGTLAGLSWSGQCDSDPELLNIAAKSFNVLALMCEQRARELERVNADAEVF